jgi:predicted ThiF/HesA family dinucleotide-utilizing enzyme
MVIPCLLLEELPEVVVAELLKTELLEHILVGPEQLVRDTPVATVIL